MSQRARIALPLLVLALGMTGTLGLVRLRPSAIPEAPEIRPPLVQVARLEARHMVVSIEAHGTVAPRTETQLVAEIAGRVTSVAPGLASGGFFEAGDTLVEIDPADYALATERAEAGLEKARSDLSLARTNLERSRSLVTRGVQSSAALDTARNAERAASAAERDARARLAQTRRDLGRTHILAPFTGRVRRKSVDLGQYVTPGSPVALIYAVDFAEVRLPLRDEDAAFLDLPIGYRDPTPVSGTSAGDRGTPHRQASRPEPRVILRARFAGREHEWLGRLVRTEGEIDPRTRMIHAVARVEDPYGRGEDPTRPPLAVGMFVRAEIEGRTLRDVVPIPRTALRGSDQLAVVDAENRVRLRRVNVVMRQREVLLTRGGLIAGDRVPVSPLDMAVDGMLVRAAHDEGSVAIGTPPPAAIRIAVP